MSYSRNFSTVRYTLRQKSTLNITGKPCFIQNSFASSLVVIGPSVPGTMGTPENIHKYEYRKNKIKKIHRILILPLDNFISRRNL